MTQRILVRAPDHLGDGVMALPAIAALARAGRLTVAAPRWGKALYGHLGVTLVAREEVAAVAAQVDLAVLLKPSFSAAWQVRRARRRVGMPTDHRRLLLTEVVEAREEHRADGLLRVAAAALGAAAPPGDAAALPALPPDAAEAADLPADLPARMVLVLPGTASAETVQWRGYPALVRALGARAVVAGGPGDEEALAWAAPAGSGARVLAAPSLGALAALAVRAVAVVGNDSGLPHLAAAAVRGAGGDPRKVHVVYASSDPARTGPPGTTAWPGPRPPCWPCYAKTCDIGAPCRDADPTPLLAALGAA